MQKGAFYFKHIYTYTQVKEKDALVQQSKAYAPRKTQQQCTML